MFWRKREDFRNPESIVGLKDDSKEIDKDYKEKVEPEKKEEKEEKQSSGPLFGLHNVTPVVTVLVVIGIILTVGLFVLAELRDDVADQPTQIQTNVSTLSDPFGALASFQSIFSIVIAAAIVLGLVSLFSPRR